MSDYRKWTNEGEADAAGAISRAIARRPGCRRAVFWTTIAILVLIGVLAAIQLVSG